MRFTEEPLSDPESDRQRRRAPGLVPARYGDGGGNHLGRYRGIRSFDLEADPLLNGGRLG